MQMNAIAGIQMIDPMMPRRSRLDSMDSRSPLGGVVMLSWCITPRTILATLEGRPTIARMRTSLAAALVVGLCLTTSGCTSPAPTESPQPLRLYAAASLQQVATDLGARFERETGVRVLTTFGGSADLLTQLTNGAPGDVLVTADEATMQKAQAAKLVTAQPRVVATNTLVIAVPPGNPRHVAAYADLARPGTTLVRCAPQVPCGAAARQVERVAGVTTHPVSEENSVSDVLGKVTSGQADAGLVYATDVTRSAGKAQAVSFPEAAGVVNRYPIAPLAASAQADRARQLADFVAGPEGRAVFAAAGFGAP